MKKTHGMSRLNGKRNPEYSRWQKMKARCADKNDKDYGGRGIAVCNRWLIFSNYFEDMGTCPKGLSLDRRDNSKGYSKDNCRWATPSQQTYNRRPYTRTKYKTSKIKSEVKKLLEEGKTTRAIASKLGVGKTTVWRISNGYG